MLTKEQMVIEVEKLLREYGNSKYAKETLSKIIAVNSIKLNHLYVDMGFESRSDMQKMMAKHYPKLAERRPREIRWKKFIYDHIGEIAPACAYCDDATDCLKCDLRSVV